MRHYSGYSKWNTLYFMGLHEIVVRYFHQDNSYEDAVSLLFENHGLTISLRTLLL